MIRDYLRCPNRYGAGRHHEQSNESYRERNQRPMRGSRHDVDWDRWPDAEALRWSPRSDPRDEAYGASRNEHARSHGEGYGYGDPYFDDDQRGSAARFHEGWEGNYRSAPWTLGAEQVAPGLHGPYGRATQHHQGPLDELFGNERRYGSSSYGEDEPYQRGHRGLGPQGYTRSDERIREDVCDRLTEHPAVDARNVQVTVENGVVLLQGMVAHRSMKYCAEDSAGSVSGVKDIDNRIRVDRSQRQSASEGSDLASHFKP